MKTIMSIAGIAFLAILVCCREEAPEKAISSQVKAGFIVTDSISGLIISENYELVKAQCTPCHSAKLIVQNRATRDGWQQMIRWMQESQGLWDLGVNEPLILDYLVKHYSPENQGRRAPLSDIQWYDLQTGQP